MIYDQLATKLQSKEALVGVIGLGYVGLPLALALVDAGFRCRGFDVDSQKVDRLNRGDSYIGNVSSERVRQAVASGCFDATANMARLEEPDAILICVPTPLTETRDPDLSYIESTARQIAASLRRGQLIVLESTTYPGTTREVVLPLLAGRGLELGNDYFLAYSPEREDPGNPNWSTQKVPKVVSGIDEASRKLVEILYGQVVAEIVPVSSCEVAEAAKILENVYRAVNIAMVNELKIILERLNIDVWEVIDAARTKPFGFQAFFPGPGLGGHCIPVDPFYLSWVARKHETAARFIELSGEINTAMPEFVVEKTMEALNDDLKPMRGSKIAILGVAYKKDVDDPRESPAFRLMELLEERGANLSYNDPHVPTLPKMRRYKVPELASQPLSAEWLQSQDCVLIVTDHSEYKWPFIGEHAKLIVDTRNAMHRVKNPKARIVKA
jgi:UDP-N-acetyl-D-glucosamine dehydrogenase